MKKNNTLFLIAKSKVTGQYCYCPKPAASILRLELDDKPTGLLTVEAAKEEATRLWGAQNFEVAPE